MCGAQLIHNVKDSSAAPFRTPTHSMFESACQHTPLVVGLVPRWRHTLIATAAPPNAQYVSATDFSQLLVVVKTNCIGVAVIDPELFGAAEDTQRSTDRKSTRL